MKKFVVILILFSGMIFAQNEWEIEGIMPQPVAGAEAYTDRNNIYIFGGFSDSTQDYVDWIQQYKVSLNIWKNNGQMNLDRFGFSTDLYNDSLYIVGGVHSTNVENQSIESWSFVGAPIISAANENFNRIFSTGSIYNGNLYLIGGNPYPDSNVVKPPYIIEYNISSAAVTNTVEGNYGNSELPEQQMSARIGDDIYIFGGVINGISQKIYKYNVVSHKLDLLPVELLEPRAGGKAIRVSYTNSIWIIGGFNENSRALKSVEIFTPGPAGYSVEPGSSLNYGRVYPSVVQVENYIYVLGGFDEYFSTVPFIERNNNNVTGIENSDFTSRSFRLFQNYPNPFNPSTEISFSLKRRSNIEIDVYSGTGEEINSIASGEFDAGMHRVKWNGKNKRGINMPSGVYLYKLKAGNSVDVKKMLLLR